MQAQKNDDEEDQTNYNVDDRASKKMTFKTKDKNRLSFKPLKGQNQWTRQCQKNGDQDRRPD